MADKDILNSYVQIMPAILDLYNGDVGFSITDREKYVFVKIAPRLGFQVNVGEPVRQGSAVRRAMEEGHRVKIRADKSVFGVPYLATAVPIRDHSGRIIGAFCFIETTDRQEKLKEMAVTLTGSIVDMACTSEEISAQAEQIAALTRELSQAAHESQGRVRESDQVLGFIRNISGQTNLLGLNAAIEAARVGEMGRGFGVVAEEIRKLATSSGESVKKIETIIRDIKTDSSHTSEQLEQINAAINQIAEAMTLLASSLEQAGSLAAQLDKVADSIIE